MFLDGYECKGRSLEQTFVEDERLVDQMKHFPDSEHLEIAHAHNTPANTQRLRERKHQEKLKILIVTSDYHAPRVAQTTGYYFTENMPEQIDVLGVNSGRADMKVLVKEFFARWQTWAIFKHLERGSNPERLTQAYDAQIYNVVDGNLVKKPLLEQGRIFLREALRR